MIVRDSINHPRLGRVEIGYMPEQVRWEGRITVNQALSSIAMMREDSVDVGNLIQTVGLASKSDQMLDSLSQGMRQRLSLACALIGKPKLLVMDEPLNGTRPFGTKSILESSKKSSKKGCCNCNFISSSRRS